MAPLLRTSAVEEESGESLPRLTAPQAAPRKYQLAYINLIILGYAHIAAMHGIYLIWTFAKWETIMFNYIIGVASAFSITAGAHRLWSHRAYKAKMPLQVLLMVLFSITFQDTLYTWVRNHRVHHRYSDTDADPHNSTRGFFFSHIGWLLVKKHPEVRRRREYIEMTDIASNPVLRFQKRCGFLFLFTLAFVLPCIGAMHLFGETFINAWNISIMRFIITLHVTSSVNSFAHLWGYKPYDNSIKPAQNLGVSFIALGEGYHNYHHTYPWDYRTSEFGNNKLNLTTRLIDFFVWIGWAYDLKSVPEDVIQSRCKRTGDGTDMWGHNNAERESC